MNVKQQAKQQVDLGLKQRVNSYENDLAKLMQIYGIMNHIRFFEEACAVLYTSKYIGGFCHLYSGQEAVGVGIQSILKKGDNVITAYRCHAHAVIARMMSDKWTCDSKDLNKIFKEVQEFIENTSQAKAAMAELMGRQTGGSKGKGGSMHLYDPEYNFYGGHGIVGIQIPLGVGLAFADKYHNRQQVTFASLGDGAMNQGQVYEAMNMAALWKLPVVFVLENNGYAIGTSQVRCSAGEALHKRADGFGIKSMLVDGMNILEVAQAAEFARTYAINEGPIFIEMDTYRYRPHSMSDPATYRTRDEVKQVKETRDPISFLRGVLKEKYGIKDEVFEEYEKVEQERIAEVIEYCKESPFPGEEELETDIWASPL